MVQRMDPFRSAFKGKECILQSMKAWLVPNIQKQQGLEYNNFKLPDSASARQQEQEEAVILQAKELTLGIREGFGKFFCSALYLNFSVCKRFRSFRSTYLTPQHLFTLTCSTSRNIDGDSYLERHT